jgi:hypothetical protein
LKNVSEYKIRVLIFSTSFSGKCFILRRTGRDRIKNVYWSSCKVPVIRVTNEEEGMVSQNTTLIFGGAYYLA